MESKLAVRLWLSCVLGIACGWVLLAQTPLTPLFNLRLVADTNGALAVDTSQGTCGTTGNLQPAANLRVKANSSGALMVCGDFTAGTAPSDATYITQTANASLSAEQALAALATGIMRVATTTGVVTSLTDSAGISGNLSDETGTGALVFGTTPTIATPIMSGSAPTVANVGANSCGTTAAAIAGNDSAGIVTVGATSGTQCRVTMTTTAPNRWQCIVNNETTANLARVTVVSTTVVDFLGTFVGGDVLSYVCLKR